MEDNTVGYSCTALFSYYTKSDAINVSFGMPRNVKGTPQVIVSFVLS